MSKYLKSGQSHYLKSTPTEPRASVVGSAVLSDNRGQCDGGVRHPASGYTELDTQLFDKLAQAVPAIQGHPATALPKGTYQVAYAEQDTELFDQLHPGAATQRAAGKVGG